ncbi:MAG: extracellular solute-binding protein [Calditrichae bacterium]|nr:extracellular solute-binding protein [Calditrichia bacterium]
MQILRNKINAVYFLAGLGILVGLGMLFYVYDQFKLKNIDSNSVTQIFFADNISKAHQKLINRFNEEFKGEIEAIPINLPFTKFSTNERKELLARSLRSKSDRIDVFAVDLIWVPRFARWGEPLGMYIPVNKRSRIMENALESCYVNHQLIAVPFYIDVGMMYYRRDLLETLPDYPHFREKFKNAITWEEFIELHQRLNRPNNPFYMFPAKNYEGLVCSFIELLACQEQSIFAGDSVQLNTPATRKGLQLLVDLVHDYNITPPVVTEFDEMKTYRYALTRDALFFRGWPGFLRHFDAMDTPEMKAKLKELEMAALPYFKGAKPVSVYGGWNLMISKFSTKKNAALEFIRFVMRDESQKLMFEEGGYLPVNQAVYRDSLFLKSNPELNYYRKLLRNGVHRPYVVDYTKISDIISYYVQLAIKKDISVSQALTQATEVINSKEVLIR